MSTDAEESRDDDHPTPVDISLTLGAEGDRWVARDEEIGVATQGPTREAALTNLDEAVALHHGAIGREPTDDELRELGIDPEAERPRSLPDVLT
jgi:predicted RNase H-like HicB family nuclease